MIRKLSEVSVVRAPKAKPHGFFGTIFSDSWALLKGMRITLRYLTHPSTVVTEQYPENRASLKLADRARTKLSLTHDDNGFHKCTACTFCEQACPNASIRVFQRAKSATGKPELDYIIWRADTCTYCNACVVVCPFTCLTFKGGFESSVFDKRLLSMNLTKYAGPTSSVLMKIPDAEERKKMIEPRTVYSGPGTLGRREK